MESENNNKQEAEKQNKDGAVKPDEETLHTTDPQEHMKGPISSLMQAGKETIEEKGGEQEED